MEKHYICTGTCSAVSDKPGTCSAEKCTRKGQIFERCDCADGKHEDRQAHQDDLGVGELGETNEISAE